MRTFWAFCAGASLVGMVVGYILHSPAIFIYNATTFMLDLGLLFFAEEIKQ